MVHEITTSGVVVTAAHHAPREGVEVSQLVKIGGLFGFADNAVRVAVTRLCGAGRLESVGTGRYRLTPAERRRHKHGEQWRSGDERMRPWKGSFLAVSLPPRTNANRGQRRASEAALDRLGFREGVAPRLYLRPDNLRQRRSATEAQLSDFGLQSDAEIFVMSGFSERSMEDLMRLWPTRAIEDEYRRLSAELSRSLERAARLPLDEALVELSVVGGATVYTLAVDPLLPDEMVSSALRAQLTELGLRYHALVTELWMRFIDVPRIDPMEGAIHAH